MPVTTAGFMLKPVGFFTCNPALDVPAPHAHQTRCDAAGAVTPHATEGAA
jgi:hypothetical protein